MFLTTFWKWKWLKLSGGLPPLRPPTIGGFTPKNPQRHGPRSKKLCASVNNVGPGRRVARALALLLHSRSQHTRHFKKLISHGAMFIFAATLKATATTVDSSCEYTICLASPFDPDSLNLSGPTLFTTVYIDITVCYMVQWSSYMYIMAPWLSYHSIWHLLMLSYMYHTLDFPIILLLAVLAFCVHLW